ncbi:hypothetical protein B566_EDAN009117 [Ephemera danica]|nr:hypothetical protein B566_EDAN009117 [Ephemera danica]
MSAKKCTMVLGRCLPFFAKSVVSNAARIQVKRMELDQNLLMYFNKTTTFLAHDPEQICKPGDVVLVQELPKKLTPDIAHKVLEVVYPLGDVTDPITSKKVVVGTYREQIAATSEHYGVSKDGFDYEKAPPRGWQEDKKDFTHRRSYIKYHEYEDDDQPYAV